VHEPPPKPAAPPGPIDCLLELIRRARTAESSATLRFIAVNDSHLLTPYQQAALWVRDEGVVALSGLTEVEANAPYVLWLGRVVGELAVRPAMALRAADLPQDLAQEWEEWLPAHAYWVPFTNPGEATAAGGLLFARPLAWRPIDGRLLEEWVGSWHCAWRAVHRPTWYRTLGAALRRLPRRMRRKPLLWAGLAVAVAVCPVRLSVLAPGELVPARPVVIRAPLDGVLKTFEVATNETIVAGQTLFTYDSAEISSRLDVALEQLRTAEIEERLHSQQALNDTRSRGLLAAARGVVEQRRIEVAFLRGRLERSTVKAPAGGVAFVDDPSEWIGRPVLTGQPIMRLARLDEVEIEAWLPAGDAVPLAEGAPAQLYLSASPLKAVDGRVKSVGFDAVARPDGSYAYRVRAALDAPAGHRVGLKGTVRLSGRLVPLAYWVFRRPIATVREYFGI